MSSGVVDGGKAAKLMAGSALYSGRDRAMVRVCLVCPRSGGLFCPLDDIVPCCVFRAMHQEQWPL